MADYLPIAVATLRACVEGIFRGYDLRAEDAATVADNLIDADLRGVHSHGVWRVDPYVQGLKDGTTAARPEVAIVRDEGAQAVVDGGRGLGQIASLVAMREVLARVREYGIAAVAVRNNGHCGTMAYWAQMAVDAGCIGIAISNAGIHLAPTGAREKVVGNNPLAIGAPTGLAWPLMLDMAMSTAAGGKVMLAARRGDKIPLGWGLDAEGNPTDDPSLVQALVPIAGPKGYGLAVMMDVLAGVLSGGRYGNMLGMPGHSQFFLAIEVERYLPLADFHARVQALIAQIHAAAKAPGVERVFLAGEREYELAQTRRRDGIPIDLPTLHTLERLAAEVGVDCTLTAGK